MSFRAEANLIRTLKVMDASLLLMRMQNRNNEHGCLAAMPKLVTISIITIGLKEIQYELKKEVGTAKSASIVLIMLSFSLCSISSSYK